MQRAKKKNEQTPSLLHRFFEVADNKENDKALEEGHYSLIANTLLGGRQHRTHNLNSTLLGDRRVSRTPRRFDGIGHKVPAAGRHVLFLPAPKTESLRGRQIGDMSLR